MKTHQKITLLLSLLLFVSCLKNKEYSIEGRLMYGCGSPAANEEFVLYQYYSVIQPKRTLNRTVKTDEEGYFKFIYKRKEANLLEITMADAGTLLGGISSMEDVELGDVYYQPTFNFIIKLEVDSSYTDQDTLTILNHNDKFNEVDNKLRFIGPFEDRVLDTVYNEPYFTVPYYDSTYKRYKIVNYILNGDSEWSEIKFEFRELCNDSFHEGVIKL